MTPSRKRRNKSAARRALEWLLLGAGVAGVGVWIGSKVIPPLWQAYQNQKFEQAKIEQAKKSAPGAPERPKSSPERPKNGQVLGRLTIPRLEVNSMVREGDDETTLSLALGHIPGTALPGQTGNVGVAGHRDTLFRALRKIHKDDTIQFETLSGTHVYEVDSTRIVKPEDVAVLRAGAQPSLTLVTCYPFYYVGSAPERFIVRAHEVNAAEVKTQSAAPAVQTKAVAFESTERGGTAWFMVRKGDREEIAPGVSIGVTDTDSRTGRVYGWILLKGQDRTILVDGQPEEKPLVFSTGGRRRELRFTEVSANSAMGSLLTD